eukprot:2299539-Heterocapsa_arctica.AAC.1
MIQLEVYKVHMLVEYPTVPPQVVDSRDFLSTKQKITIAIVLYVVRALRCPDSICQNGVESFRPHGLSLYQLL